VNCDAPADPIELPLQVRRLVRDFDDPVSGPVHEPALYGRGPLARDQFVSAAVPVVNEEHPPVRFQALGDQRPETREAVRRNVGEPEAEEHHVVAAIRPPVEQVGRHEAHPLPAYSRRGESEHLRGCVHGGEVRGVAQQLGCPCARAAGQLEHAAGRLERVERLGQLRGPGKGQSMVGVLGSDRLVVADLFVE
jgi:hypothetical protein